MRHGSRSGVVKRALGRDVLELSGDPQEMVKAQGVEHLTRMIRAVYPQATHVLVFRAGGNVRGWTVDAVLIGPLGVLAPHDRQQQLDRCAEFELARLQWRALGAMEGESALMIDVESGLVVRRPATPVPRQIDLSTMDPGHCAEAAPAPLR
jgi:hypothetical protein